MKCTNCEMVDQLPGTKCSHCGRLIPEPKPVVMTKAMDDDASAETETDPQASNVDDSGQETTKSPAEPGSTEAPAETETSPNTAAVTPEKGHVDNVGDETETETVVP